ncbi:AMP-binding protein [Hydrogenovibrio halophilus]|uniref:AMP-binding protein n=1 Tax=Hydrogenovibrio halophilus TaxID=373391 RepID=UPI0012FDE47B|nr:AMP-binding protein [Hydrogenovibrio halophilus]
MSHAPPSSDMIAEHLHQALCAHTVLFRCFDQAWSKNRLLALAHQVAQALPDNMAVINLAQHRPTFFVTLLAAALKKVPVVLPPNTAPETLSTLAQTLADTHGLNTLTVEDDRFAPVMSTQPGAASLTRKQAESVLAQEIWLYTSGSTGQPKRVVKTWGQMLTLARQALVNLPGTDAETTLVATVPSQHMFGLETTVFWPFVSQWQVWADQPFFAEDIAERMQQTACTSWLVSTPLHLSKLAQFDTVWPTAFERVLSATAPLTQTLADQVSRRFGVRVCEVYGSTETASIAWREREREAPWRLYDGNRLQPQAEGMTVEIGPLQASFVLQDRLQSLDAHHFAWLGREQDLVKVAGKRTSLAYLNERLKALDGVRDGVFLLPSVGERLTALVVSDRSASEIKQALARSLDPVFVPRPLLKVASLPRNELGKIQYERLKAQVNALMSDKDDENPLSWSFAISAGHPAMPGHFPGHPVVPGALLLAQVEKYLVREWPQGFLAEVPETKFLQTVLPDTTVTVTLTAENRETHRVGRFEMVLADTGRPCVRGRLIWQCHSPVHPL